LTDGLVADFQCRLRRGNWELRDERIYGRCFKLVGLDAYVALIGISSGILELAKGWQ
jgi:hypothetical protein